MKNELLQLNKKLSKKRDELDAAIENGEDIEIIFQKSVEIDQVIAEYQGCKTK